MKKTKEYKLYYAVEASTSRSTRLQATFSTRKTHQAFYVHFSWNYQNTLSGIT